MHDAVGIPLKCRELEAEVASGSSQTIHATGIVIYIYIRMYNIYSMTPFRTLIYRKVTIK